MSERILEMNVYDQYKDDMQKYTIFISRRRVIPEYKDGLKPVHRKILYCMYNDERAINHSVKSAAVVGSTMKLYHPHGDMATYGAIKPLTNWFEINIPLIDNQGNFGNFQGDDAAAARYTEINLSKFAMDCVIADLQETKQVVDWIPNYSETCLEPEYLPVSVPLLLINGSFGIGSGVKIEIPRHNINEVIDTTLKLMDNQNSDVVLIPDHCMPCDIINTNWKSICNKGNGTYTVRGRMVVEEYKGRQALVIKSIPDLTFLDKITEKIEKLIIANEIIQIQDMVEETDGDNMRFVIVLKKGADPEYVKKVIYKKTEMEKRSRINFETLDGINPLRMSYKSYLLAFIEFRKLTKFRLYCNRLQQVQTKIHEREIYIKVLQSGEIDNIIDMIKKQTSIDDNYLVEYLVTKLSITDLQAKFVLGTDIRKLSKGYLAKYIQECNDLSVLSQEYMNKITNEQLLVEEIKQELVEYKSKYGRPRRCKIISENEESNIPQGEFKIIITENNYIKKIPLNDSIGTFRNDAPKIVLKADNIENIIIFDELGKVFKLPVHKIPFTDRTSPGTDIRYLIKNLTSNINTVMYEPRLKELSTRLNKYFLVVVTAAGYIKKLDIEDFLTVLPGGILYTKLDEGDVVKDVMVISEQSDVIVYSKNKALRISMSEVPHLKRNTRGSRSINTNEYIDGISIITNNTTDIVVVTESGKVNRFSPVALPLSVRGKAGSNVIKLSKGDRIKFVCGINSKDSIRFVTKNDKVVVPVTDIQEGSSVSSGVKMIGSGKGDIILRCDIVRQHK